MAEVLGLVASVIQVAGAGLKLSQTLYQYADGVVSADRRIKDIAKEIELTSFVIEELGGVFEDNATSRLISKNAVKTANETMKECSSVFAEIDATLKKSKKNSFGRFMLPFRDSKIELLRNHIDKLKSTLQLLMQVLTHAYQVASKKLDREAEERQREEIKELLENKKKSTKRYEESLKAYSLSDSTTVIGDDHSDELVLSTNALDVAASALGSTINAETLGKCVQHVRSLLEDIESLQRAITTQVDGDDHSDHHQTVLGSYFRARGHLDSILFGSNKGLGMLGPLIPSSDTKVKGDDNSIQRTVTGSTLDHKLSRSSTTTDAEYIKAITKAKDRARAAEEQERTRELTRAEEEQGRFRSQGETANDQERMRRIARELIAEKEARRQEAEAKQRADEIEAEMAIARIKAKAELEKARHDAEKASTSDRKATIKFQDTLGRKYAIPFQIGSTWKGMYNFITQAYRHDLAWLGHVEHRSFDLIDSDDNTLLPEYWNSIIEPGMVVRMKFWSTCTPIVRSGSPEPPVHLTDGALKAKEENLVLNPKTMKRKNTKALTLAETPETQLTKDEELLVVHRDRGYASGTECLAPASPHSPTHVYSTNPPTSPKHSPTSPAYSPVEPALRVPLTKSEYALLALEHNGEFSQPGETASAWNEAVRMQSFVVSTYTKTLGELHPDTLSSMASLANIYIHAGDPTKAAAVTEQIAQAHKQVLGSKVPETAPTAARTTPLEDADGSDTRPLCEEQAYIHATTGIMRDNIDKAVERGSRLDSLADKHDSLAESAQAFRRSANRRREPRLWDTVYGWLTPSRSRSAEERIGGSFPGPAFLGSAPGSVPQAGSPASIVPGAPSQQINVNRKKTAKRGEAKKDTYDGVPLPAPMAVPMHTPPVSHLSEFTWMGPTRELLNPYTEISDGEDTEDLEESEEGIYRKADGKQESEEKVEKVTRQDDGKDIDEVDDLLREWTTVLE